MTQPLPFADESFDLIFHPVSNCYVEKVEPIFLECYRVLKKGGILLCGLDKMCIRDSIHSAPCTNTSVSICA